MLIWISSVKIRFFFPLNILCLHFLKKLHIFGCFEHDMTFFEKYLFICVTVSKHNSKINAHNFMKVLFSLAPWRKLVPVSICWKSFNRGGCSNAFLYFLERRFLDFYCSSNILHKVSTKRNNIATFNLCVHSFCNTVFSAIFDL